MNAENSYNLIDEQWIPVLMRDGTHRLVSLGDVFADTDGTIADLALNPYERVSVFRLLLCIAQAAMDQDRLHGERSWLAAKDDVGPAATDYLAKWKNRFFLYGPHAFMQVDCLVPGNKIPVTSLLVVHSAHHFGSPLFSREIATIGDVPLASPMLAVALLTYLNYSASGGTPICIWNGSPTRQVGPASAPCRSKSKLFTIVMGESLLQTVWMNLLTTNQLGELKIALGHPCWEFDFDDCRKVESEAVNWLGPVDKASRKIVQPTLLGLLAPLSRFVKLERDKSPCLICEGFGYPPCRDPLATYYVKSQKNGAADVSCLQVNKQRMPWRDLSSILELGTQKGGAMALTHLATLATKKSFTLSFSIWTGGLYSKKDQDSDMFTGEWLFTRPLSMLRKESLSKYQEAVDWADRQNDYMKSAAITYSEALAMFKVKNDKREFYRLADIAESIYWDILVQPDKQRLVLDVNGDDYFQKWKDATRNAAEEAYRRACPAMTARQMEAFAQGFSKLTIREDN